MAAGSTRGRRTLAFLRDPPQHGRGRLIQTRTPSAATRPVEAGRSDSAACRCRRSPPARGQRCRYIHSHPATIMHRDEPAAGQRCGQPDPVRQRPHRDGTCERQPLRPRSKLHLRSAFQTTGIELPASPILPYLQRTFAVLYNACQPIRRERSGLVIERCLKGFSSSATLAASARNSAHPRFLVPRGG